MNQMQRNMIEKGLANDPNFQRAKQMVEGKNEDELLETAENLCKQRGIDLKQAYKAFEQFQGQLPKMFGF